MLAGLRWTGCTGLIRRYTGHHRLDREHTGNPLSWLLETHHGSRGFGGRSGRHSAGTRYWPVRKEFSKSKQLRRMYQGQRTLNSCTSLSSCSISSALDHSPFGHMILSKVSMGSLVRRVRGESCLRSGHKRLARTRRSRHHLSLYMAAVSILRLQSHDRRRKEIR